MKKITFILKSLIVLILIDLSTQFATGQTTTYYDFNTAGQLSGNFNQTGTNTNITQSTNTGISGSGAINITSDYTNDVFATKLGYALGLVGSTYTFSSYIKSVWNGGYSGLGFTTASPAPSGEDPYHPNASLGISVHGGGYVFHNDATSYFGNWNSDGPSGVTTVKKATIFDLLNNGSPDKWYKIIFIITRATSTTYNMRVEVWPSYVTGVLINPGAADAIFEVNGIANSNITSAPLLYSYFSFSGSRVSDFDNYSIELAGSTVVEPGNPVVLTTSSSQSGNTITLDGNVTSNNGAAVTARGIVYGTSTNPTISNYVVTSGSDIGTFSATTPALSDGTYYLRTYATNSVGTSYGSEVSYTVTTNYNITYNADGGTHSNPATFTVSDLPLTLTAAGKTGYTFDGWFDNAGFTGSAITQISTAGDITLWAKFTIIVGVSEITKDFGKIFPNPTSGIVNIESMYINIQKLVISDLSGKQLIIKTDLQKTETIDLSGFSNGVYLITIRTDKELITRKIVKE